MDGSIIGALLGGVAMAFGGAAAWTGLRGVGDVFELSAGIQEMGR